MSLKKFPDELKNVVTFHVMTHMVGTYFIDAKYGNEVVEICVKNGRRPKEGGAGNIEKEGHNAAVVVKEYHYKKSNFGKMAFK